MHTTAPHGENDGSTYAALAMRTVAVIAIATCLPMHFLRRRSASTLQTFSTHAFSDPEGIGGWATDRHCLASS